MGSTFLKSIFSVFLLIIPALVLAQDLSIKKKSERILINKDTSFVKHVSVELKKSDEVRVYPVFYDSELEKVSNIQVFSKKGKRFKPVKDKIIGEEDVKLDYIASKKIKSIVIPPETEAKITYTIECSELMYFSDLRFFSNNTIDTLKYEVSVPNTFRFIHNTIYRDSLEYIAIDSINMDSITRWNIEVAPIKVEPDPLMLFGIYRNMKVPLMRAVIIPESYKDNGLKFMNDWYLQKVVTKRGLNPKVIQKVNELTQEISDPKRIMEVLYDYVKNNFKYVAIEIGMGAFIPTHANEVFLNKHGDCKDLSNFLSEILNYKGVKSDIALAATYNHISDCDFPSLSSANHVVCLAYINDDPIILDPTDPIHLPETPVQSLQRRSILIVNEKGGEFYKINGFKPEQNLIDYQITVKADSDQMSMEGAFKVDYNGISGNFLRREHRQIGSDKLQAVAKNYFESVFNNQSVSHLQVTSQGRTVGAEGNILINGKIYNDTQNKMLFIDFLPAPMEAEKRETLLEGTHMGNNFNKKVKLRVEMDEPFERFTTIEHELFNPGVSLSLKISSPTDAIIEYDYEFVFDYITIEKENRDITNQALSSFKKIINEPIILKKKG